LVVTFRAELNQGNGNLTTHQFRSVFQHRNKPHNASKAKGRPSVAGHQQAEEELESFHAGAFGAAE
jgi:hypothetical protein